MWADVDYLERLRRERRQQREAAAQPESRPSPARAFLSNLATRAGAGIARAFGYNGENTDASPPAESSAPVQAQTPSQPYTSPPPAMTYVRTPRTPSRYRLARADAVGPQADPRAGNPNLDQAQAGPSNAPHRHVRRVTPFVSENMGSANRQGFHHGHPPPASNDQYISIRQRRPAEQSTRLTDISEEARDALQTRTPLPRWTPQSFEEADEYESRDIPRMRTPRAARRDNHTPPADGRCLFGRLSRNGRRAAPIHSVLDMMQHSAQERHHLVRAARETTDGPVRARHERALTEHEVRAGAEVDNVMDRQPENALETPLSPTPAGASIASDPFADPPRQAPQPQTALEQNDATQSLGAALQASEGEGASNEHEDSSSILSDPFADPFDGLSMRSETEPLLGARADPDQQQGEEVQSTEEDEVTRNGEGEWSYQPHWNWFWARRSGR